MLTVTVTDESGAVLGAKTIPDNDYFVLTTGTCTSHTTVWPKNGTHVVTFRGRNPNTGEPS